MSSNGSDDPEYMKEDEEEEVQIDDANSDSEPSSEDEIEVEKIIGISSNDFSKPRNVRYYIKPKDDSYIHCKWAGYFELEEYEKGISIRDNFVRRCKDTTFRRCIDVPNLFLPAFQNYDPDWVIPEMVIGTTKDQDQYFIKWKKQPFSESTWEYENLVHCGDLVKIYKRKLANAIPCKTKITPTYKEDDFKMYKKSPKYKKGHKLSDYQIEGLNWLRQNYRLNRNNILADEMGLGKTIQALSLLSDLKANCNVPGPFLVITPLSTIENWMREISEWTEFEAIALYGTNEDRKVIIDNCLFHPNNKNKVIFNILVVPINLVSRVLSVLVKIHFHYLIVDEAHRLKNFESRSYKEIRSLQFDHCTFLTGTPVQNDMTELYALLHFLDDKEFPSLAKFNQKFGQTITADHIEDIQKAIQPYLLRRKKADVNIQIGQKEEIIVEVELTRFQRNMYKTILQENRGALLHEIPGISFNNIAMQLRKICNHPYTIKSMENIGQGQYKSRHNIPQSEPLTDQQLCESIVESSGKMIFLDKILPILGGHRVLIFSQMTSILDIIEDYCYLKGYNLERIDGSVVGTDRQERIDRFQNSPDSFLFLLSTKAGGLGLNLTIADTVIIYDSDWNPQNDIQAQSRCHRIGQTMDVNVYRLVTRGTYEDEMFKRASKKLGLDTAILDAKVNEVSEEEIEAILQKGALFLLNEDDNEIDKFENEDIQQILERRTTSRHTLLGNNSMFSRVVMSNSSLNLNDDENNSVETTENEEIKKTVENNSNETTDSETSTVEQQPDVPAVDEVDLSGRNIWKELFADLEDEEEFDRIKKIRKTGAIWSKDDAMDVIKKVIYFGWVGLINDDAISQTKVYTKTLAWAAYCALGKPEKHRFLMKKLIGLAPNDEISSYLNSEPFSDIGWFRNHKAMFEQFLQSLDDMFQICRCLTYLSVKDFQNIIPLTPTSNTESTPDSNNNDDIKSNEADLQLDLPNWWTFLDDYSLLFGFYRYGFFDFHSMLTDDELSFKWRIDLCGSVISPTSEMLIKRKDFVVHFLSSHISDSFTEDIGEICTLHRWMYRQRKFIPNVKLSSDYLRRYFFYMSLNGVDFKPSTLTVDFLKIHQNANLNFLNPSVSCVYITSVIRVLLASKPILRVGFSSRMPKVDDNLVKSFPFESINDQLVQDTAEMIFFFIRLRGCLSIIKQLTPEQIPEWSDGPPWWNHGIDDIKLATVVAKFGFGSMTQIATHRNSPFYSRILPFDTTKWIVMERMTLVPFISMGIRKESEWLSVPVLRDRLLTVLKVVDKINEC